jgi:hypothetical protein
MATELDAVGKCSKILTLEMLEGPCCVVRSQLMLRGNGPVLIRWRA